MLARATLPSDEGPDEVPEGALGLLTENPEALRHRITFCSFLSILKVGARPSLFLNFPLPFVAVIDFPARSGHRSACGARTSRSTARPEHSKVINALVNAAKNGRRGDGARRV